MKFEDLNLHDATINSIWFLWNDKILTVNGQNYSQKKQSSMGVVAPIKYCFDMQSGDVIVIEAEKFKFSA